MTDWDEAEFRKLAEAVAAELGLTAEPGWHDQGSDSWHGGARLMAANGTGWHLTNPSGYGMKGMTHISPVWPGRSWPPGGVKIKAGITASRGPEVIAARIRQLAPDYRAALADLAVSQARDAAEEARRASLAAKITEIIPDDDPDRDPRHPRVHPSPHASGAYTELYIGGAGTLKFYREAAEIEIDRFRAPAEVVLAMLQAYADGCAGHRPVLLEIGPAPDYSHELRDPPRPPTPERAPRATPFAGGSLPGPRRAVRPELISGALRLLAAVPDPEKNTGTEG